MANMILTVPAHLHNPTSPLNQTMTWLSELFLQAYQYQLDRPAQEVTLFIEKLRQLVASGYKACRQYPHRRKLYEAYRQQFLQYDGGDFRKHLSLVDSFAQNLAKMVYWALQSYHDLELPDGYETFLQLLEDILKPEKIISLRQQEVAYQFLAELKQLY